MGRTFLTISVAKNSKPSRIISVIRDIRAGDLGLGIVSPRPRLRWSLQKCELGQLGDGMKFALRVSFTDHQQRAELTKYLTKQFSLSKSTTSRATDIDILPTENGEDAKAILEELVRHTYERRVDNGDSDGKYIFSDTVTGPKKKIIVEFGSPNIAKPLHVGHLRSAVTGHYVSKICKAMGHQVTNMCFLGDWGTQFGLLQAGLAQWGQGDPSKTVDTLDLDSLLQYYIRSVKEQETNEDFALKAREHSAALEKQDPTAMYIWGRIREKTVQHLEGVWEQLRINYDVMQGESEFATRAEYTEKALTILKDKKLCEIKDGCVYAILPLKKGGENVRVPLLKSDGSSLYLLRDIAAVLSRQNEFCFDQMIYVVDKGQSNHFINLFSILSKIDEEGIPNLKHVSFGKIEGMSTRSGNFVLFSDVIRDGSKVMEESRLKSPNARGVDHRISKELVISALITHFLRVRRNKDCNFDWSEALRSNGDTGVRLQYTHSRLRSLEAKAEAGSEQLDVEFATEYILSEPIALDLMLQLANFDDAVFASFDELEPSVLLSYLFNLCNKTSKALKELRVLDEPNSSVANTRLFLFMQSRKILAIGLHILGIKPLDEI